MIDTLNNLQEPKYRLTSETVVAESGAILHRIEALRDIPHHHVKNGDLGGYIESTANLSQEGSAWVGGKARVSGDARVSGNALVGGNAHVSGEAHVGGNAHVGGDAVVLGKAKVRGETWVGGNAKLGVVGKVAGETEILGGATTEGARRMESSSPAAERLAASHNRVDGYASFQNRVISTTGRDPKGVIER